jgi:hypothetical protein
MLDLILPILAIAVTMAVLFGVSLWLGIQDNTTPADEEWWDRQW